MRRRILALLILTMLFLVIACGKEENKEKQDVTDSENNVQTEISNFEEITVVDNEQCIIRVTGIDPENIWGYAVNVYMENKSSDMTYMYSLDEAAIDGVSTMPLFASEITPGNKENSTINFMDAALTENKLEFTDIELTFRVYNSNDYEAEPVASETVHVYPKGQEAATVFVREDQASDQILVDNETMKMVVVKTGKDEMWGYKVDFYIVNKSSVELMISAEDVAVNGFMLDPYYAESVPSGRSTFSSMYWSATEFEDNKIEQVESIEVTITAGDANDWLAEDFVQEKVTIKP